MNVFLWILQFLLAIHTAIGAVWKFSNSEQVVPSLKAIPHGVWMGLSAIEIVCSLALVLPIIVKSLAKLPPIAAAVILGEMLLFTAVHFASGATEHSEVIYWLVVAALCGVIVYGRTVGRSA